MATEQVLQAVKGQLGGKWKYDRGENFEDALREMGKLFFLNTAMEITFT